MMQELTNLCMSDIGRLLGTLGLLSLGMTLTLWGLKRRRSGAVVIALFLCLAALVPVALAQIEIPPPGSVAQIQTSGPDTLLGVGDWYTSRNPDAGGQGYHSFNIYVPCAVPPTQMITVELYDPESNYTTIVGAPYPDLDEIRPEPPGIPVPDNTTFTLTNPSGVVVAATTYTPIGGTSQSWVTFATFAPDATNDCGIYSLRVTTSEDDDNAWRLRVTPDDPDGTPGTGDEISLGNLQTSYQHEEYGCQTFHFFVPDNTSSILLSNFDMDLGTDLCDGLCTVVYTTPSGTSIPGTVSGSTEWSGGGTDYPPPEDMIPDPESGWWQAQLCLAYNNQYIFDTDAVFFFDQPPTPDMTVSKDDGTETFDPGGMLTYTITYTNAGDGAALNAALTDTLPLYTTFVSCSGGLSCGYVPPPPGSGIVTFSLGTVRAGESGSVTVSVRVDLDAPPGAITNTVELDYTDILFSDYPVETDTDVNRYEANPGIEIVKTVYLGHDGGASCAAGSEIVTGTNGAAVTYCFEVNNTGNTHLDDITIDDADLGIDQDDMTLQADMSDPYPPLAPGGRLVYYYETTINGDLVNTATTEGNPTDSSGNDLPGVDDPTDDDTAEVEIGEPPTATPTPEPSEPGPPPPPPTPTPTLTPTPVGPTPTVEVLTVAMLPETGGFPGWFTVVLGVPIIIGAAGLLNLAVLEMRGRRGHRKGD